MEGLKGFSGFVEIKLVEISTWFITSSSIYVYVVQGDNAREKHGKSAIATNRIAVLTFLSPFEKLDSGLIMGNSSCSLHFFCNVARVFKICY